MAECKDEGKFLRRKRKLINSDSRFRLSRKNITVLFTDIEDSTRYWDAHGDVRGRLMVDQHNRLLFPIIKKYKGRVVKTIGDAIMATFKKPGNAVKAAIAMQQMLERERQQYHRQILKVRIGIHSGQAIVEQKDVFGDMVNVAARVEGYGKGNEILVSNTTAAKCRTKEYFLARKASVTFKGKGRAITLYRCQWREAPSLIDDVQFNPYLPLLRQHQIELILHVFATLFALFFLYLKFLRYYLADTEQLALWFFHPFNIFNKLPATAVVIIVSVFVIYMLISKLKHFPETVLKLFNGGYCFCLVFFLCYGIACILPITIEKKWNESLFESAHSFVEVRDNNINIRQKPTLEAAVLKSADSGDIFLLMDEYEKNSLTWSKVLIKRDLQGWILRVVPAKIGVPPRNLTKTYKFYFRYCDLYAIGAGLLGFLWGFIKFRMQPV
jgi:class 3 adenylate cyclase